MVTFKCKMCGGNINAEAGISYGTCDSCGTTSTLPKVSDERLVNLFNRANHYRRLNEFDKTLTVYESILNEDNTNAEAHWCAALCRYGIEYVEDPRTRERIPTCHRVQYAPILTDADYLAALEYAPDDYTRSLYEAEARKISEIQKGILAISQREEPFDVFICYKETADDGNRTKDSVLAQDIYYQLNNEGYRVFFAKITLEDKLGQEYEPYIFAALNSAKVMLVIGTQKEHFEAVWVRNEWSRFLAMMKGDRSRLLIPCYRDMDPYDLPQEFAHLQAQDMGKIGFIQDLIRGVKKVLDADKVPASAPGTAGVSTAAGIAAANAMGGIDALLKRAYMFLEDGNFVEATGYFNKVLDADPENAFAYAGLLCAETNLRELKQLAQSVYPLDQYPNFQKAMRFGDDKLRAALQKCKTESDKNLLYTQLHMQETARRGKLQKKLRNKKAIWFFIRIISIIFIGFSLFLTLLTLDSGYDIGFMFMLFVLLPLCLLPFVSSLVMRSKIKKQLAVIEAGGTLKESRREVKKKTIWFFIRFVSICLLLYSFTLVISRGYSVGVVIFALLCLILIIISLVIRSRVKKQLAVIEAGGILKESRKGFSQPSSTQPPAPTVQPARFCASCGSAVQGNGKFCMTCGAAMEQ